MKKHLSFWLVVSLVFLLALPIYSMAQMKLTLEDSTGNRISTPGIKSFAVGTDNNLVIYLNEPFNFTDLLPPIQISGSSVSPPATVTAIQGSAITFTVTSSANATLTMEVSPEPVAAFPQSTGTGTFTWNTGGNPPVPTGPYLAVFKAAIGAQTSELVVMININPSETVSTPTAGGPTAGSVGVSYNFTASGSTVTPSGHDVQYMFIWDNQTNTGWLPVGQASASKSWSTTGTHTVTVQARCSIDTGVVSSVSSAHSINISNIPTPTLTINVNPSGGGTVTVNGQTYTAPLPIASGTPVTLQANPATGYNFSNWAQGTSPIGQNPYSFNMGSTDTAITANFTGQQTGGCTNRLDQRIASGFFGIESDNFSPGIIKTYCLPLGDMGGTTVSRLRVGTVNMGTINEADVDMEVTSPSGQKFYSSNPNSSDEIVDLRSQNYPYTNYQYPYIESGNWTLQLTARGTGSVKIYWIYY